MTVTGEENSPPIRVAFALFDIIAGLIASNSILAAIIERSRTGQGKFSSEKVRIRLLYLLIPIALL